MSDKAIKYTAADALNDALVRAGVTHIFLNSGTDYPPIIESWAKYKEEGKKFPEIIICPQETVAMCAAQGFAQVTGNPQAVFVHVDVGTQNIGGAVENTFRARVPALIFAGLSPYTMNNELKGTRNSMIQFLQNVSDQAGVIRGYVKYADEIRTGKNIQQMIYRALQLAKSDVQAPVYLMAAREVLEEEGVDIGAIPVGWQKTDPMAMNSDSLSVIVDALLKAKNPLIVTTYLGRQNDAVYELVKLCNKLAIPVIETQQSGMNFPGDNKMHMGIDVKSMLEGCDVILAIDSDIPWIPAYVQPPSDCRLFFIDIDPIKDDIPLWNFPAERYIRADSLVALRQLNEALENAAMDETIVDEVEKRRKKVTEKHDALKARLKAAEAMQEVITTPFLTACIRELIDEDTIVLNETITDCPTVELHLTRNRPGTLYVSGGSSLGWTGGAAIGAKLACPDRDVIALTGDGSYIFTCPAAVYWVARKYHTPFMTIVFNNGGWTAPKAITAGQHPDGHAAKNDTFWNELEPSMRYDLIAEAAGGAFAATVDDPAKLMDVLKEGQAAVRSGHCAVINVILPKKRAN